MKRLFDDTRLLDEAAREKFGLSDDVMMENAAAALENRLKYYAALAAPKTLIACGSGDNGGDGYALARRIPNCIVWSVKPPKSASCIRQKDRAEKVGVRIFSGDVAAFKSEFGFDTIGDRAFDDDPDIFGKFDAVVDCIFGSGFHGEPDESVAEVIRFLNGLKASKIACDVPSCLSCADSSQRDDIFKANTTATMGALKKVLYAEYSKDYVGDVYCTNLGVTRDVFEGLSGESECAGKNAVHASGAEAGVSDGLVVGATNADGATGDAQTAQPESSEMWLLEKNDFAAPKRKNQCVHKGTFGHAAICIGEKIGAGIIAGEACFAYGAGLVTLVSSEWAAEQNATEQPGTSFCPPDLMTAADLPKNTTAVALGMGLGRGEQAEKSAQARLEQLAKPKLPCVLDADIFYAESLPGFLTDNAGKMPIVLTPHPKEFLSLLGLCGITAKFAELSKLSPEQNATTETSLANKPEGSTKTSLNTSLANAPDINYVIKNRESLSAAFCKKYPGVVLLVKGASPLISTVKDGKIQQFVNPLGKNCLAKGGSGDVLSGLICALLAQGYSALDAAVQGSLAHSLASDRITTDYGMTPFMLIDAARYLGR